jgi:hypothetical protein
MMLTEVFELFIGLIINVVMATMLVLSTILIRALLTLNIDKRAHDFAIGRMLGSFLY